MDAAELIPALRHGLSSDTRVDWNAKFSELVAYVKRHGDAHCGFRSGDDPALTRWCRKNRHCFMEGALTAEMEARLLGIGFEFDDEEAEWLRWYGDLREVSEKRCMGHSETGTLGDEFYLTNWCAVQRIARRSGVMKEYRIQLLDALGFDWTGADPLS
jgi:hypothetical protein